MSERAVFLVDPYLLEEPAGGEWDGAARAVLAWASQDQRERSHFVISSECLNALMASEKFPYVNYRHVATSLRAEGESWLAAVDLCRLVNKLLEECRYLDVKVLCADMEIEPSSVFDRLQHVELRNVFPEWVVGVKLNEAGDEQPPCELVVSRPGGDVNENVRVSLSCHIEMFEGPAQAFVRLPVYTSFAIDVLVSPPRIEVDLSKVVSDPIRVIAEAYEQQVPRSERALYPLRPFSVGNRFVSSILTHRLERNQRILGIIVKQAVRLVSGQAPRFQRSMEIHPQREGPGPNDPPVTRSDGAVLYRLTLTVHKEGYRLMYWQLGDSYELAEIRTESE